MKLNYQLEKYSENINQSDIVLWRPENKLGSFVNKVYDSYNKGSYLQSNKKC